MAANKPKYQPVIGLEIHVQLLTASKLFCKCSAQFGAAPNSHVCPICLGLPGALPMLNRSAVTSAIKLGLATHCQIARRSVFVRKKYFYPDLPKGYQISQFDAPLGQNGYVEFEDCGTFMKIAIARIHLEEDAGKLIHDEPYVPKQESLIDFNRCGVPLIEIVTAPEIRSARQAVACFSALRQLVRYLEISDGNLEQGSMRCDANISVRQKGTTTSAGKTEIKNLNSLHSLQRALEFEINRQIEVLESGGRIVDETMLWDVRTRSAIAMRRKEASHDYRYFPEPDLIPLTIDQSEIEAIQKKLPELPLSRRDRFVSQYHLDRSLAARLTSEKVLADYFEQAAQLVSDYGLLGRWIMEIVWPAKPNVSTLTDVPISSHALADLLNLLLEGSVNERTAREIFKQMSATGQSAGTILRDRDLIQIADRDYLTGVISSLIQRYPEEVAQFRAGKSKLWAFFMGQVMERTRGRADPHLVTELLRQHLSNQ